MFNPFRHEAAVVQWYSLRALERKVWSSKLNRNTTGIRQEGHSEFYSATLLQ